MFNWLKFVSGSIVLDSDAKEASRRKFWNVLFFLFATLIILSFLFGLGYNTAFNYHYNHSSEYQQAYRYTFSQNFNCSIAEEKLFCADEGVTIEEDKNKKLYLDTRTLQDYTGKYEIIVDTRDKDAHVNFTAYYVHKDNKENKIDHLAYLQLPMSDRENYSFDSIDYTNEDLNTEQYLALATTYYEEVGGEKKEDYLAIDEDEKLTAAQKVYNKINLFVGDALPGVINDYNTAPILNAYYATEFLKTNSDKEFGYEHDRYILFLQESLTTSFVTDKNVFMFFEGSYRQVDGIYRFHYERVENNEEAMMQHIKDLVDSVYGDIRSSQMLNYAINIFRYMPMILIIMVALALFMFILTKLSGDDYADNKYLGCFKIVAACSLGATILTGIIGFILPFFMNQGVAFVIAMSVFISLLILRVLLLSIISYFKKRKQNKLLQSEGSTSSKEKMELL